MKFASFAAGALIAAALLFSPFCRTDVSELLPIQTLCLRVQDDLCRIETDSGLMGQGGNLSQALEDLSRTAPGVVELSTTKQLVIEDGAEDYVDALLFMDVLRPGTELYRAPRYVDVTDADAYLSRHSVEATVARAQAAYLRRERLHLPCLVEGDGRYCIVEPENT